MRHLFDEELTAKSESKEDSHRGAFILTHTLNVLNIEI